ncbi:MAG: DNA-directed RNA polymerase subunit alpha [bacterium (Candidatus Stahlbacteria) CG23_combo_of_CG06-09_8_20_14_all_34_7]|nr:MAG: DNA-directed RNA polymerase subunit alpha [bacterium (Candidatus Stahlbacteria) CG23_combo_of_CG06-09_8_20_14_all_34_7]
MKLKPFQMPKSVKLEEQRGNTFGKFVIGPFERGFGTTMGNVLRRILLSSIHGVSITKIIFENAFHEFTTIDGVKENVTDIVLNIKKIRFRMDEEMDDKRITINIKGPKEVVAGDISLPAGIEIVNNDLYLFTITKSVSVKAEMVIEWGRGYLQSQYINPDKNIKSIQLDAFFSPVKRVVTTIENMRVGQRTDYDKLILEITTDGTITPENALKESIIILKGHINVFEVSDIKLPVITEEFEDDNVLKMRDILSKKVTDLELKVRAKNCLEINKIEILSDLVVKTRDEMLKYKNFGRQSLGELEEKLKELGLHFGMDVNKYFKKENN